MSSNTTAATTSRAGTPLTRISDERFLVAFAQSGDESAFGELIAPYVGRLRFWIQKQFPVLSADVPFADAIEALALEDARRGIKGFRCESSFSTWLHAVAYNRACKELQRRNRDARIDRRDFEAIAFVADDGRTASDLIDQHGYHHDPEKYRRGDPVRVLIRKQRCELEQAAIKAMTPGERAVYVRMRFRGLKYADIARELRISEDAARRRMADAKARVRRYVEAHESPRRLSNLFKEEVKS
jgi:RNA polymerase sigma factor (sigma-70 family)